MALPFLNYSRFCLDLCLVVEIENTNTTGNIFLTKLNTYIMDFKFKFLYPQGTINLLYLIPTNL